MNRFTTGILAGVIALGSAVSASAAHNNTPRVDRRIGKQDARIERGVDNGKISSKQAARLEKREKNIATYDQNAKAAGDVTQKKRDKMRDRLDRQKARIHRDKSEGSGR